MQCPPTLLPFFSVFVAHRKRNSRRRIAAKLGEREEESDVGMEWKDDGKEKRRKEEGLYFPLLSLCLFRV